MRRRAVAWGVLACAFVLLAWAEARLERRERAARDARHRIGRLVPRDEREALDVAVVEVGRQGEPRLRVVRGEDGVWRCPDRFGAPADPRAVEGLVKAILDAEGVVVTRDPKEARDLGIGTPSTWIVVLAAREGSPRIELRLGLRVVGERGCYVQRADEDGVWRIDTDPWGPLGLDRSGGRPPLLDPHIVPAIWPGETRRVDEIRVERGDGVRYRLTLHDVPISEEEFRQGKSPFEWRLHLPRGAGEEETRSPVEARAVSYASFLFLAPWSEILGRTGEDGFDFGRPRFSVTLVPRDGETLVLSAAAQPLSDGRIAVSNSVTGLVLAVESEVARLLAPDPALLESEEGEDPFAPYVRRP